MPTEKLLQDYKQVLLTDWEALRIQSSLTMTTEESVVLVQQMNQLINKALVPKVCADKQWVGNISTSTSSTGTEVEVQQEVQQELAIAKEVQMEAQTLDALLTEEVYQKGIAELNDDIHAKSIANLAFKTLQDICQSSGANNIPEFNQRIGATVNFYQSYQNQKIIWVCT